MRNGFLAVLGSTVVGAGMLLAQAPMTIHGFVSDAHCGAAHSAPSEAATKCINKCMKKDGAAPVVVSDGKVYNLKGDVADVAKLAGENVTVEGTVDGDTLTVTSVKKS